MRAAIYARVSTLRQGWEQTIGSQLEALKGWARGNGHDLSPEDIHTDEGYTGSRLDRPGLDALRDGAEDAAFEVIGVLSPDRLARKYAYQRCYCWRSSSVMAVRSCSSVIPSPTIPTTSYCLSYTVQIQGAIAEYERAMIAERFRRGKLQKAREGHYIGAKAPYGYRYVPKRDGVPGHLIRAISSRSSRCSSRSPSSTT